LWLRGIDGFRKEKRSATDYTDYADGREDRITEVTHRWKLFS
jgi:hypothetical protein